jgi:hypothetical protein
MIELPERVSEPSPEYRARLYSSDPSDLQPDIPEHHPSTIPCPSSAPELDSDELIPARELRQELSAIGTAIDGLTVTLRLLVAEQKGLRAAVAKADENSQAARAAATDYANRIIAYLDQVTATKQRLTRIEEHLHLPSIPAAGGNNHGP